jgi:hypothetical protein
MLAAACTFLIGKNNTLTKSSDPWSQKPTVAQFWSGIVKVAP